MEIVNRNMMVELARKEPADDTSTIWWVTLKMLRKFGYNANVMGKGIAIILRGRDGIHANTDARIETFVCDARNVRTISARSGSDRLSDYHSGLAFSVELYADLKSYSPVYGFVPANRDPVELAKNYLFALRELTQSASAAAMLELRPKLGSGEI
jgi:hypothetical protein